VHAAAFQHRAGTDTEAVRDLVLVAHRAAAAAAAGASPSMPHAPHVAAAAHAVSQAVAAAGSGRMQDASLVAGRAALAVNRAAATMQARLPPGALQSVLCVLALVSFTILCRRQRVPNYTCCAPFAERLGDGIVPWASLRGQDFVYVTATSADRHALIAASRIWRQVQLIQYAQTRSHCTSQHL
jgi:hypothetical protein